MNPCMKVQMYVAYTNNTSDFIYCHQVALYKTLFCLLVLNLHKYINYSNHSIRSMCLCTIYCVNDLYV